MFVTVPTCIICLLSKNVKIKIRESVNVRLICVDVKLSVAIRQQ
jgi:hypothetical protein